MTEMTETAHAPDPDRLDLAAFREESRRFARFVVRSWRLVGLVLVVGAALSLAHSMLADKVYRATVRALPYKSSRSDLGNLSSIAGLAGISLPNIAASATIPAEVYPEIVGSLNFRSRLLDRELTFGSGRATLTAWLDARRGRTDRPAARTPTAPSGNGPASLAEYPPAPVTMTDEDWMRARWLGDRMSASADRRTGVLTISAELADAEGAASLVATAAEMLTQDIVALESRRAAEQVSFLEQRRLLAEQRFQGAQEADAAFRDQNRVLTTARGMTQGQRLQRELAVAEEVLRSTTAQLEAAQFRRAENTPVFAILEPAVVPTRPVWPRPALSLALSLVASFAVATALVWRRYRRIGQAGTLPDPR